MTDFTKTKTHFALAFLGTLFALHPFLQAVEDKGFLYLGYDLKLFYVYGLLAGLLALSVYCYGLALVSERPHSWLEKLGNYTYALAVMVLPLYGGLYLASLLAEQLNQSHLAWAAPTVALGLGVGWFVLSQLLAWMLRGRLGAQDRAAKTEQLARLEVASVNHAKELFESEHYDLSVMEVWRAVEARLQRVLLGRGKTLGKMDPETLVYTAKRAGFLSEPVMGLLQQLRRQLSVAMSTEPITREAADTALTAARHILASIALDDSADPSNVAVPLRKSA
jgi:hypothetical protein